MTSTDVEEERPDAAATLTVRVASSTYTLGHTETPVIIGRADSGADQSVRIPINDSRISRRHLVIDVREGQWIGLPEGRNGVFVDGIRQESAFVIPEDGLVAVLGNPFGGIPVYCSTLDPDLVFVGARVAQRRAELDLSQRTLAANKIINAGALIAFEKGRSWPRDKTRERLEEALGWPAGTIARMRREHAAHQHAPVPPTGEGERTEVIGAGGTTTVDAKYMAETIALALANIHPQIKGLPSTDDDEFHPRITALLGDLARLETLASNASRGSLAAPEMTLQLSAVRRAHRDLMMRAAASPRATLGQRLFAARHRAELSIEEAAAVVGLGADELRAAEAGQPITEPVRDALHRLLAALQ